jgi:hypothetical protein
MSTTKFHQEKIVNGILSYRKNPKDAWTPYTGEELTGKINTIAEASQLELADTTRDNTSAVTTAINNEKARILAIVDAEPEPGTPLPEELKIIDTIPKVELGNLIVRATKKSIRQAILKPHNKETQ